MMMSFHLPPTAANAAVSGQSVTGLRRADRRYAPRGAFLRAGIRTASLREGRSMHGEVRRMSRLVCLRFLLVLCGVAAAGQTGASAGATEAPPRRDGQHDFDFHIGAWKTHLSRLLRPL